MMINFQELNDQVYLTLESMILFGELKPGTRILQDKISDQLGVSRISLLKALQRLESELLVEKRPRSGVFVRKFETQELIDAFECRVGIECVAVRLAAQRITPDEISYLQSLFQPYLNEPNAANKRDFARADREFHKTIIHYSNNPIIQKFDMVTNLLFFMFEHFEWSIEESLRDHLQIIDALRDHNGRYAEQLMREHIGNNTLKVTEGIMAAVNGSGSGV